MKIDRLFSILRHLRKGRCRWMVYLLSICFLSVAFHGFALSKQIALLNLFQTMMNGTIYRINDRPWSFNLANASIGSANDLLKIYQQQLTRYSTAAFLPTYENDHLRLKLDTKSIATDLFGHVDRFRGSVRHLQIICWTGSSMMEPFRPSFNFTLHFKVKKVAHQWIDFTLQSMSSTESFLTYSYDPMYRSISDAREIIIDVHRRFPRQSTFRFTYQWLDQPDDHCLQWPRWPLTKICADQILNEIIQSTNLTHSINFGCSVTRDLIHSTSHDLYDAEKNAIQAWLDLQHLAMFPKNSSNHPMKEKRRSIPFEIASDPTVCSSAFQHWISEYQTWHASITSEITDPTLTDEKRSAKIVELNVRFLLYEKHTSGNADRMVHLISTYLIAILTKRLFLFDDHWPEFHDSMQSSLNYDRNAVIPWYTQKTGLYDFLFKRNSDALTSRYVWFGFDRLRQDYDYNREFPERILRFRSHTGALVRMITSNSSVYRRFLTEDLQMNADNLFGCLYHSLLVYRLSALIEAISIDISRNEQLGHSPQQLLQLLLAPDFYPIGVQVRVGDSSMDDQTPTSRNQTIKENEHFLLCARDLIRQNETTVKKSSRRIPIVFLLSDSAHIRQDALRRWQLPLSSSNEQCHLDKRDLSVIANPNPVLHITYTKHATAAFRLALFDIFLFSLCEEHIITHDSGFGRIAVFASLRRRNIYSLLVGKTSGCDDSNQSISLKESGSDWSGI